LPAFPDTCKAINLLSLRTPCQALKSGRKEETRIVPPEAFLVQTCVYDPAAQSVRAVAWFPAQEGVGNAGCPRTRSRVRKVESTRVSHHGYAGTPGIPARNGFNGFLRALPGDRAFLPPSPADVAASLTPASGRQDHTSSPSASGAPVLRTVRVHCIPPASVTIAIRPSSGTRRRGC
jgi:hypothetical protein